MVLMTTLATLTIMVHSQTRWFASYKRHTSQKGRPDAELRMVSCIHTTRNIPSIISLLDISNPSKTLQSSSTPHTL
ncbi:Cation/H(+) antiporter [Zostera marina]|uniref:Cation/H(+) antiporter n=1 Tax=Zostera marina TaxID=29655 RepID=A0A0K9PQX8_ZOSMR|nr:Cation/H(+) antiporter [Zostera marina]